jgi:hypothetical protein
MAVMFPPDDAEFTAVALDRALANAFIGRDMVDRRKGSSDIITSEHPRLRHHEDTEKKS